MNEDLKRREVFYLLLGGMATAVAGRGLIPKERTPGEIEPRVAIQELLRPHRHLITRHRSGCKGQNCDCFYEL